MYCACIIGALPAGKQLANAAVSLRVTSGTRSSSSSSSNGMKAAGSDAKPGSMQNGENNVPTQKALDLLDANDAQAGERVV